MTRVSNGTFKAVWKCLYDELLGMGQDTAEEGSLEDTEDVGKQAEVINLADDQDKNSYAAYAVADSPLKRGQAEIILGDWADWFSEEQSGSKHRKI